MTLDRKQAVYTGEVSQICFERLDLRFYHTYS